MKLTHSLGKLLHEVLLNITMDKQVVGSNTCLTSIEGLAPGYALCRKLNIGSLVDNHRALATKFENYRCEIFGCRAHDNTAQCGRASEEDNIVALLKQRRINLSITLDHGHIALIKTLFY